MWMHNEKAAEDSREENTALRLELEGKEYEVSSLKAKLSFHELQEHECTDRLAALQKDYEYLKKEYNYALDEIDRQNKEAAGA